MRMGRWKRYRESRGGKKGQLWGHDYDSSRSTNEQQRTTTSGRGRKKDKRHSPAFLLCTRPCDFRPSSRCSYDYLQLNHCRLRYSSITAIHGYYRAFVTIRICGSARVPDYTAAGLFPDMDIFDLYSLCIRWSSTCEITFAAVTFQKLHKYSLLNWSTEDLRQTTN
jgi:hypothetical protein